VYRLASSLRPRRLARMGPGIFLSFTTGCSGDGRGGSEVEKDSFAALHGPARRRFEPALVLVEKIRCLEWILGDLLLVQFETISFFGGTVPHSGHRSGVARRS
jgi:hypothetical protein